MATKVVTDLTPPRVDGAEFIDAAETLHKRKGIKPKRIYWVEPSSIGYLSQQDEPMTAHFFLDPESEEVKIEILDGLLVL
jgi:hypothetical protein